jgi:hypothetical protein
MSCSCQSRFLVPSHAHLRQPAHHLDGRLFQQRSAILWCPHRWARLFSSPYTPSTTQGCRRCGASLQPDFAGQNGQVGHSNGQGVPVLPVGQCPQTCPAPSSRHSGTTSPFRPQTCQPCWPASSSCGHMHHGGQRQFLFPHHCCRLCQSPIHQLDQLNLPFGVPAIITSDIHIYIMGSPLQPAQHRPLPSNSLPPTNP